MFSSNSLCRFDMMLKIIRYLLTPPKPKSQEANVKIRRHGNLKCLTRCPSMSSIVLANENSKKHNNSNYLNNFIALFELTLRWYMWCACILYHTKFNYVQMNYLNC